VVATSDFVPWSWGLLIGAGGAIAGAISGKHPRLIVEVLLGAAFGWYIVPSVFLVKEPFVAGVVCGAPPGAILGAITSVILQKTKPRS
jgi:hypothetical protein